MKKLKAVQPPAENNIVPTVALPTAFAGSDKSPSKVWSGILNFGLISMPICLMTAATEERISFNQLHAQCNGRIKQQLFCPSCNQVVQRTDLSKGFEYEKDKYVIVTEDELTGAEPKSGKILELSAFVPAVQVDSIFFESCYYLAPLEGGQKPYALVREAMLQTNLVGVARIVRNGREHVCVIRPHGQGMVLHTLFWINEVRGLAFPALPETSESELRMAKQLVQMLAADWNPTQYTDSYREAVLRLIATKRDGKEVVATASPAVVPTNVVDITSALQRSLDAAKARKGVA
jgi:DNA end-binding protein Ku